MHSIPLQPTASQLIADKRDGLELSPAAIDWLVKSFVNGQVADYQMSAFAMAVCLRGMSVEETVALTLAMASSGTKARLRGHTPKVDKHSTGGVGDKVSICLAPLVAACGVRVPMICGRGLGHTGGTLDKLESIPGFDTKLSLARFERIVSRHGFAIMGATPEIAPADRKLYALRDVTATVESVPLITASILSKKLCEDLDALVLDVKVGRGAFMKTHDQAAELAHSIVRVGAAAGLDVTALLTRMDAPLGRCVGNSLEAIEAFEVLNGGGDEDLIECTLSLGEEMLRAAKVVGTKSAARRLLTQAIRSGAGIAKLEAVVREQGGDPRVVREPDRMPRAPHRTLVHAARDGFVTDLDAMQVALSALRLGAGRTRADQDIDARVGIELLKKPGAYVRKGEALACVHAAAAKLARAEALALLTAFTFRTRPKASEPLVLRTIRSKTTANA